MRTPRCILSIDTHDASRWNPVTHRPHVALPRRAQMTRQNLVVVTGPVYSGGSVAHRPRWSPNLATGAAAKAREDAGISIRHQMGGRSVPRHKIFALGG
jgi:hypothetical protein